MEKDVTEPVAAVTMASATRPVDGVSACQAGPDPTAQKVSEYSTEKSNHLYDG